MNISALTFKKQFIKSTVHLLTEFLLCKTYFNRYKIKLFFFKRSEHTCTSRGGAEREGQRGS